jgi:hypothetical protein
MKFIPCMGEITDACNPLVAKKIRETTARRARV